MLQDVGQAMTMRVSCSWCHEMNDMPVASTGAVIYCANCQHRADVLREKCDCRKGAEDGAAVENSR